MLVLPLWIVGEKDLTGALMLGILFLELIAWTTVEQAEHQGRSQSAPEEGKADATYDS